MTLARRIVASAAIAGAALSALLVGAAPAWAVQTTNVGLEAAPGPSGPRPALMETSGAAQHDAVIVYDPGRTPVEVHLAVVAVARHGASYVLGAPGPSVASVVRLGDTTVSLRPGQRVRVPVSIGAWPGGRSYAAVTAEATTPTQVGDLVVAERLAVLVFDPGGGHRSVPVEVPLLLVALAAAILAAAASGWARALRRRQTAAARQ